MKNLQKGSAIPFIISIVALLAIGAGYLYLNKDNKTQNQVNKIYTNEVGKYSIMYPQDMTITEELNKGDIVAIAPSPTFKSKLGSFFIDTLNFCEGYLDSFQSSSATSNTINGKLVYYNPNPGQPSFSGVILGTVDRYYLVYPNDSQCYLITTTTTPAKDTDFNSFFENSILNSFKISN